jgi:hypothetical protein
MAAAKGRFEIAEKLNERKIRSAIIKYQISIFNCYVVTPPNNE